MKDTTHHRGQTLLISASTHTSPCRLVHLGDAPLGHSEIAATQHGTPARLSVIVEVTLEDLCSAERENITRRVNDGEQVVHHHDGDVPRLNWDPEVHYTWIDALHDRAVASDWHTSPCNPTWTILGPSDGWGDFWVRYATDPFRG